MQARTLKEATMIPVRTHSVDLWRSCAAECGFPVAALLLGATALTAAAAGHAQDQGEPFPGFCFAFSNLHASGWDEKGCLDHWATCSKWVEGECVEIGTHCNDSCSGDGDVRSAAPEELARATRRPRGNQAGLVISSTINCHGSSRA